MNAELNPPSLAAAITARGFTGAPFRVVEVELGYAEPALAQHDNLVQLFGHTSKTLCAFGTATMRALDLPTGFL